MKQAHLGGFVLVCVFLQHLALFRKRAQHPMSDWQPGVFSPTFLDVRAGNASPECFMRSETTKGNFHDLILLKSRCSRSPQAAQSKLLVPARHGKIGLLWVPWLKFRARPLHVPPKGQCTAGPFDRTLPCDKGNYSICNFDNDSKT